MSIALVLYSHSEYFDVLDVFDSTLQKYFLNNIKKYLIADKNYKNDRYENILYDSNLSYSERMSNSLKNISEEIFLFIHEDMILYKQASYEKILELSEFMYNKNIDYIRLIKTGNDILEPYDYKLFKFNLNSRSAFAVQPTLWKKNSLMKFFIDNPGKNMWQLEEQCQNYCLDNFFGLYYFDLFAKKRGEAHWDSSIFPYTATAICKGKWNFKEYEKEIKEATKDLKIDLNNRGFFI